MGSPLSADSGEAKDFQAVVAQVARLTETPFEGTALEYPAFAMQLGEKILDLVEPYFQDANLSPEDKKTLIDTKHLGLLLRWGFDEAEYDQKYEEFLKTVQDYALFRSWIDSKYYQNAREIKDNISDKAKQAEALSQLLDRWAPLINQYFNDDKRIGNEQLPSNMVTEATRIDPDGSSCCSTQILWHWRTERNFVNYAMLKNQKGIKR